MGLFYESEPRRVPGWPCPSRMSLGESGDKGLAEGSLGRRRRDESNRSEFTQDDRSVAHIWNKMGYFYENSGIKDVSGTKQRGSVPSTPNRRWAKANAPSGAPPVVVRDISDGRRKKQVHISDHI